MPSTPVKWFACLCFLLMLAACGHSAADKHREVIVSAAASLADSLAELRELYESKHPAVKLKVNYGGSGALQRQIEQGASVDLFLAAGEQHMQALLDKGYIEEVQILFANRLVAVVQADSDHLLPAVDALADSSVERLAIGEPDIVPAGFYARQSLQHHGIWEAVKPALIFTKDVRQALHYVETGNADAAYVYETDAASSKKVRIAFYANPASHSPIVYPAGLVKESGNREEALAFFRFLASDEAQAIFHKHGFQIPENGG